MREAVAAVGGARDIAVIDMKLAAELVGQCTGGGILEHLVARAAKEAGDDAIRGHCPLSCAKPPPAGAVLRRDRRETAAR